MRLIGRRDATSRPAVTQTMAVTATPSRELALRMMIDSGGITTRVRFWAAPTIARPDPSRIGSTMPGTSERAAGSATAIPTPWSARATTKGSSDPAGSTPGRRRIPEARM